MFSTVSPQLLIKQFSFDCDPEPLKGSSYFAVYVQTNTNELFVCQQCAVAIKVVASTQQRDFKSSSGPGAHLP